MGSMQPDDIVLPDVNDYLNRHRRHHDKRSSLLLTSNLNFALSISYKSYQRAVEIVRIKRESNQKPSGRHDRCIHRNVNLVRNDSKGRWRFFNSKEHRKVLSIKIWNVESRCGAWYSFNNKIHSTGVVVETSLYGITTNLEANCNVFALIMKPSTNG